MNNVADKWKIESVLHMAQSVPFGDFRIAGLTSPEGKTIRFMRNLGFTRYDVYRVFLSLTYRDYVMGPLADDKGKRFDLWVFGKYVEAFEAYIKFAAFFKGGRMRCLCVSFHEAERKLFYPYGKVA